MRKSTVLMMFLLASSVAIGHPMGGYGMGPGMMQGHGMGPGMMGGMMGPGMMGGYGMGFGGTGIADLTSDQRSKIAHIQKEMRNKQWALMEKMHEGWEQGGFYRDGRFDEQAARKAYERNEQLHRQMFENHLEARKRIDNVLTPEQRQQLQRAWNQ